MGFLTIAFILFPITVCVVYFRYEWHLLKIEIQDKYSETVIESLEKKDIPKTTILTYSEWSDRFKNGIQGLVDQVNDQALSEEKGLKNILSRLDAKIIKRLCKKGYDRLKPVVEDGSIQSLLVKQDNLIVYLVVLPGLHDHPNLLKRYPLFRFGWTKHFLNTKASLESEQDEPFTFVQITAFMSPSNKDGLIYIGASDNENLFLPARLVLKDLTLDSENPIILNYTQSF